MRIFWGFEQYPNQDLSQEPTRLAAGRIGIIEFPDTGAELIVEL
jgi:hypothetical protein